MASFILKGTLEDRFIIESRLNLCSDERRECTIILAIVDEPDELVNDAIFNVSPVIPENWVKESVKSA